MDDKKANKVIELLEQILNKLEVLDDIESRLCDVEERIDYHGNN